MIPGTWKKYPAELARLHGLKNSIAMALAGIGELLQEYDSDFDRFVRALYYHLTALIEAASTDEIADQ